VLANVVHEKSANGTAVLSGRDSAVAFLAGGIPDLSFDCFGVDLDRASGELDADGGLGVEVEFVAGESGEKV